MTLGRRGRTRGQKGSRLTFMMTLAQELARCCEKHQQPQGGQSPGTRLPVPGPSSGYHCMGMLSPAYQLGRHSQTTAVAKHRSSSIFSTYSENLTTHMTPPSPQLIGFVEEIDLLWNCASKRKTMLYFGDKSSRMG